MRRGSWWTAGRRPFAVGLAVVLGGVSIGARAPRHGDSPHGTRAPVAVLLLYDMEGSTGIVSTTAMDPSQPDSFALGRASVIEDVNAVVAGLFDGGAGRVDVRNTHGAGGDSLVPRGRLDARANILTGRLGNAYVLGTPNLQRPGSWNEVPTPTYDAVVTVAMHDRPRSGGFSPHTLGAGISPILDGRAVTETELLGYSYGTVGIPVIFASGDDRLRASLAEVMPWLEYAVVKRITGPTVAVALARDEAQRALREGAARAVRALAQPGRMRAMRLPPEFRAGLLPSYPLLLPPGIGSLPGIERRGDTVTFVARDYRSAFWGIFVLQRIATAFAAERTLRELASSADSAVHRRAMAAMQARAAAFEAGSWQPR